jgi:hypothetical protein
MGTQVNGSAKNGTTGNMPVGTDVAIVVYASAGVDQCVGAQLCAWLDHSAGHDLHAFFNNDIWGDPTERVYQGRKEVALLSISVENTLPWLRRLNKAHAIGQKYMGGRKFCNYRGIVAHRQPMPFRCRLRQ